MDKKKETQFRKLATCPFLREQDINPFQGSRKAITQRRRV